MPRRPALVTQADIARAIRAAKQEGWQMVRIVTATGAIIEICEKPERTEPVDEEEDFDL